ncbi:protein of unknown function [Moritella yayanosii]|uniref:Uncharacterized protein n=1 Tax=Moritella yayanosii TaxID=69539 RepID=A0A330LWQ8_9GAMM|nr:protein of unknown function [Moritella yayanosii]
MPVKSDSYPALTSVLSDYFNCHNLYSSRLDLTFIGKAAQIYLVYFGNAPVISTHPWSLFLLTCKPSLQ